MAKTINKKRNWYRGLTATAISLAMAGAAFSVPALAINYDLSIGDVTVDGNFSWQEGNEDWNSDNPYDHAANEDYSVEITQSKANDNSATISGDVSELDITIKNSANDDSVDVTITDDEDGNGTVISEDGITLSGNVDLT